MAFKTEEVQPENIEMIGRPVQESSCVKTRPWPSSDKQSHNHPGAADTLGTNSKPVFAHDEDEEMTKTGVEEEGLAVFEMMEEAEGVEEGKMEGNAEEKVAEAELGGLCSFEGMPGSCLLPPENMEALPQEAEPQSPTVTAEHEPHLATSMTKPEPIITVEHGPHLATSMTKPEPTVTAENGPHLATTMTKPEPIVTAENGLHLATTMTKPEPTLTAENGLHLATTMTKPEPAVTAENGPHLANPMTKPEPIVTVEHGPHLATTMAEHEPRPDGSTAEGHIKVTDRIAGQKKVFWKRQKAKPKMQMAEAAGTEGGPQNTRAPFRLQDFMCSKISKHYTVLLLLVLLAFPVNSNETPKKRTELPSSVTPSAASLGMCAVCLEPRCATTVYGIWLKEKDKSIWLKGDEEIPECFNDNLKPDKPCQGPNGSLVLRTANELEFEWKNLTSGDGKLITSVNMSCDKLNLPSKPSPAPIRNTPTPEAPNDPVADNKGSTIGGGIGGGIGSGIIILIAVLIWKRNIIIFRLRNCRRGQDRGRHQGNNGVPPHNAEHPNEITIEMQPLKGEVPNENVNGVH